MNLPLSKQAQIIQDFLIEKGIEATVIKLPDSTSTAREAASALQCNIEQIVKSLIFKAQESHRPILILASGPNYVNEKIIEGHVGEKIVKADADFTKEVTGFVIGGVPPIGHAQVIDLIYIDEDLLKFETVWTAAGTPSSVVNLHTKDLIQMTQGKVIAIG